MPPEFFACADKRSFSTQLTHIIPEIHQSPPFLRSAQGLLSASSVDLSVLLEEGQLVAFCFSSERDISLSPGLKAVSVGLVSVLPDFRGRGFGRLLLNGTVSEYRRKGIELIYLQGIPRFYSAFGFRGWCFKSKYVIELECLRGNVVGEIREVLPRDLAQMMELYDVYSQDIGSPVTRSPSNWEDLIGPLSNTFIFHCPRVILNGERMIAYFTTCPSNPSVIREFVCDIDREGILMALSTLASYLQSTGAEIMEIFSPDRGALSRTINRFLSCDFLRLIRQDSSNMVLSLGELSVSQGFILQGDNL
jgi:GNAT superfamily N-acetyltransferase